MFDQFLALFPPEYQKYLQFLPLLLIGFAIALILTPIIGLIARKFNVYDLPPKDRRPILNKFDNPDRHIHTHKVPLLGANAVLIPLIIYLVATANTNPAQISLAIALGIMTITGILDDIFNLPAIVQLVLQIVATAIIAFSTINLLSLTNPFGGLISLNWASLNFNVFGLAQQFIFPGDLLLMAWIILCVNAIKWLNGIDALMEGNIVITLLFLFIIGVRTFSSDVTTISLLTAGLLSGFLIFNLPPAKIFSGGTKCAYGMLIAVLSVMNGAKIATTMLILALPLVDAIFVLVRRIVIYKPKNPLAVLRYNDKSHLHFQLLEIGLNNIQVVLIEIGFTLLIGTIAVLSAGTMKLAAILIVGLLVVMAIFIIHTSQKRIKERISKKQNEDETPESKYSY